MKAFFRIEVLTTTTSADRAQPHLSEIVSDLQELMNALARASTTPRRVERDRVMDLMPKGGERPRALIYIARSASGRVVGMATLCMPVATLSKCEARIEDVAVLPGWRGQGVGSALVAKLIERAEQEHATQVVLTSGSDRQAAHRAYLRAGFRIHDTNVFRLDLKV